LPTAFQCTFLISSFYLRLAGGEGLSGCSSFLEGCQKAID
jgi:hypothetical protein